MGQSLMIIEIFSCLRTLHSKNVDKKRDFKACAPRFSDACALFTPRTWIKRGISRPANTEKPQFAERK